VIRGREIVTLCGSTRFKEAFEAAERDLGLQGMIVLTVACFGHRGDLSPEQMDGEAKARLDELHLDKIRLSDRVHVLNVGGYVGDSTSREIAFAEELHVPVTYLEAREMSEDVNPQPGDWVRVIPPGWNPYLVTWTTTDTPMDGFTYEVVERATPPAPDPEDAARWRSHSVLLNHLCWQMAAALGDVAVGDDEGYCDAEDLVERLIALAGLQAPPTPNLLPESRQLGVAADALDEIITAMCDRYGLSGEDTESDRDLMGDAIRDIVAPYLAGLQAPPVDDEPVGWANLYAWGRGLYVTEDDARLSAANHVLEVAVPLYRRPGVQTPAAESDIAQATNPCRCGDISYCERVGGLRADHPRYKDSAGVQSPPATPEPEMERVDTILGPVWQEKSVPVPDPETETTDG
jgi:hypothetical protein